ncbi:hypothetical protein PLICRDRAFT_637927 [Plicaturopsis crispa FD-325 SS-3]|nr:hypothetical protein PLICRDRAFT_637927 [Plicaturopsis crispa FD-325 SS-3]
MLRRIARIGGNHPDYHPRLSPGDATTCFDLHSKAHPHPSRPLGLARSNIRRRPVVLQPGTPSLLSALGYYGCLMLPDIYPATRLTHGRSDGLWSPGSRLDTKHLWGTRFLNTE